MVSTPVCTMIILKLDENAYDCLNNHAKYPIACLSLGATSAKKFLHYNLLRPPFLVFVGPLIHSIVVIYQIQDCGLF